MNSFITHLLAYFNRPTKRNKLLDLYEQTKFKLPFYINEVALYKFMLERQTSTLAECEEFMAKHTEACCRCLKAIHNLDNLVCDLGLANRYESHDYLRRYQQHCTIVTTKLSLPYFDLSYN